MANKTAKIVRFHSIGGPEVLKIEEEAIPEPGKGEALLKVKAIGLNRAEVMFREGKYLESPTLPSKLGYEAAGVVEAVGPDVDKGWIGKKASTVPGFLMTNYGVYGEVALVPASALATYPEKLTPEEGTSIWMQYLTAYGALITNARIGKGDFVIITAASSSVGIAAIEMVKAEGASSIATTRTPKKKDAPEPTPFPLYTALSKGLTVRGYTVREILSVPQLKAAALKYVFDHVSAGDFKPRIDRVFPLAQIVEAHRYMESNQQIGKIVVTV